MNENEQGLTTEERIMFIVLGIILLVALGVLAFNNISNHERKAEGTTPTEQEVEEPVVNPKKPENKDEPQNKNNTIITLEEVRNNIRNYSESTPKKVVKKSLAPKKVAKEEPKKETNEGTGSTDQGEVDDEAAVYEDPEQMDWTFNKNIVKEAYSDETIKIDNKVTLTNGTEKEAEVVIKDAEGKEVSFESNEIKLPAGKYTYFYTCNNKTKEIPLTVYNRLENIKIEITNVKETSSIYNEDVAFITKESSITSEKNNYKLKVKRQNNYNIVPLKVELEKAYNKIESTTNGFTVSNDKTITDLKDNEFIIILDLNSISLTKENKLFLTIDGVEYLFNFNISIENVKSKEEQPKEEPTTDPNKEVISNEDDDKDEKPEQEEQPDQPKPEPPKDETPVVDEKPVTSEKPVTEQVQEPIETEQVTETETA